MHHRRKRGSARGTRSRITTFRLPYDLERALKKEAARRGRRWQTVLKELLAEALGLHSETTVETTRISSKRLKEALDRLGGKPS